MKAQFVFEKFSDESDPIHDMGIGTPLGIAGGHLQKYADANDYEFQMVPIRKQESPIMFVDVKPFFDVLTGNQGGAAVYVLKYKYTITYMPHQAPNIYSLRKEWVGYAYKLPRQEEDAITNKANKARGVLAHLEIDKIKLQRLKSKMKKGEVKELDVRQNLMGRYPKFQIPEIIKRIDDNIKKTKDKNHIN